MKNLLLSLMVLKVLTFGDVLAQSTQIEDDIDLLLSLPPYSSYTDDPEAILAYNRFTASPTEYISVIENRLILPSDENLNTYQDVMTANNLPGLLGLLTQVALDNYGKDEALALLVQIYSETASHVDTLNTQLSENPPIIQEELRQLQRAEFVAKQIHIITLKSLAILGDISVLQNAVERYDSVPYMIQSYIEGFSEHLAGSYPPPSFSMNLVASWQLIGMPFEPLSTPYDSIFTDIPLLQPPFWWNTDRYTLENELVVGRGYWAETEAGGSQSVMGIPMDTLNLDLIQGWHLFSGPSCNIATSSIQDLSGIIITGTLFGFDNGYIVADTLHQGQGYWVMTNGAGQITLDCSATGAGKTGIPSIVYSPNANGSFTEITIRDANRGQQILYLGGTLTNAENVSFRLPPVPPQNFFDARFEGDSRLIEGTEGVVQLQVNRYPVTIDLEGNTQALVFEELVNGQAIATHDLAAGQSLEISNNEVTALRIRPQ